jgi:hypothetical protein
MVTPVCYHSNVWSTLLWTGIFVSILIVDAQDPCPLADPEGGSLGGFLGGLRVGATPPPPLSSENFVKIG